MSPTYRTQSHDSQLSVATLDPPHCTHCNAVLSIRHVLLDCPGYVHLRQRYNIPNDMASVLGHNSDVVHRVFMLIRETGIMRYI